MNLSLKKNGIWAHERETLFENKFVKELSGALLEYVSGCVNEGLTIELPLAHEKLVVEVGNAYPDLKEEYKSLYKELNL